MAYLSPDEGILFIQFLPLLTPAVVMVPFVTTRKFTLSELQILDGFHQVFS